MGANEHIEPTKNGRRQRRLLPLKKEE